MTDKTPGQVAYAAWRDGHLSRNRAFLTWDELDALEDGDAEIWEATAQAVLDLAHERAALNEQMFYSPMSPITDAERDALDAADKLRQQLEALVKEWRAFEKGLMSAGDYDAADVQGTCADDLERVLKGGE